MTGMWMAQIQWIPIEHVTHEGQTCYHFSHLGRGSNSARELIDQVASGVRKAVIIERNTWTVVEPFDAVVHDSLFHHDSNDNSTTIGIIPP